VSMQYREDRGMPFILRVDERRSSFAGFYFAKKMYPGFARSTIMITISAPPMMFATLDFVMA